MRFSLRVSLFALLCLASGPAEADNSVALNLGGETVVSLRPAAGQTAAGRVDAVTDRLNVILGVPYIQPSDVAVLTSPPQAPVIFVLGRRLLTLSSDTASDGQPGSSLALALRVARRLQQILPRIDYRPSNEPEPVIAPNPPLTITSNIALVGGDTGQAQWRGRTAFTLRGLQPPDVKGVRRTAAERGDLLTSRLSEIAAHLTGTLDPALVTVSDLPNGNSQLRVGEFALANVTLSDALFYAANSPRELAEKWAHEFRASLLAAAKPSKSPGQ